MVKVEGTLEKKNNKDEIKYYGNKELGSTLIMGLVGLVLVLMPEKINEIIGLIVGILVTLLGCYNIYNYLKNRLFTSSLIMGILYFLIGVIILISPGSVIRSIAIGIGIIFIATGISKVRLAKVLREVNKKWQGTFIIGIMIIILGIVLIVSPFSGDAITKFIGTFLIIVALFDIIDNYILQK